MLKSAAKAGFYKAGNDSNYPRLQILTIEDLLRKRKHPEYYDMSCGDMTFRRAKKETVIDDQLSLF